MRLLVWQKPSDSKKQKIGNASLPMVRIAQYTCSQPGYATPRRKARPYTTTAPTWSTAIMAIASHFNCVPVNFHSMIKSTTPSRVRKILSAPPLPRYFQSKTSRAASGPACTSYVIPQSCQTRWTATCQNGLSVAPACAVTATSPRGNALCYLCTRAPAPPMMASTSFLLAMVVSPGVVMASAPCAAP